MHPAPRMTIDPTPNRLNIENNCNGGAFACAAASVILHAVIRVSQLALEEVGEDEPQGQKRSQEPTGLSRRARYAYGFAVLGSEETTRAANVGRGVASVVLYRRGSMCRNFCIASCGGMYF